MRQMAVGVRDLKARLSEYLKQVAEGDVIQITSRGKVIARILPSSDRRKTDPMALVSEGLANWNGKRVPVRKPKFGLKGGKLASDLVLENRD
jgi:prevent-host-death family protein